MPSIGVAMARSLRPGMLEILRDSLARSISREIARRDIIADTSNKVTDIQTALSSWDNCMAASFCKWPVIAIIVVGSLIILSIVTCVVRCCCLGMSCCCGCFRCLKCCGDCCGCCDAPDKDKHKHLDNPYGNAPAHHGYQPQGPMHAPAPFTTSAPPAVAAPPQYAEFDMSKKGGEDSLPQMPSWEGASSRKVAIEDAVELEPLKKSPAPDPRSNPPLGSISGHASPVPRDQPSPYGPPQGSPMGGPGGYIPAPNQSRDPYAPHSPAQSHMPASQDYDPDGYGLDQPYDTAGGVVAAAAVPRHQSPAHNHNGRGRHPDDQGFAQMPSAPNDHVGLSGYGQPQYGQSQNPHNAVGPGYGMQRQGTGNSRRGPDGSGIQRQGTGESRSGPDNYGMRRQNTGESMGGPNGYGMLRQGTGDGPSAPQGYGMRRTGTGDRMGSPSPYGGMDSRARQSPGPRRTPGPPVENFRNQEPRRSPAPERSHGYGGQAGSSAAHDNYNQSYGQPQELVASMPNPGYPQRQELGAPASNHGYPQPQELVAPAKPAGMNRPYGQSPPQSPIVNNAGFDFNSGYSRPSAQSSPTTDTYPGYKPFQPAQQPWNGV